MEVNTGFRLSSGNYCLKKLTILIVDQDWISEKINWAYADRTAIHMELLQFINTSYYVATSVKFLPTELLLDIYRYKKFGYIFSYGVRNEGWPRGEI
jgi:hypothetical protein